MLKYIFLIISTFWITISHGSNPRVPSTYEFSGIKLTIDENARRQIQEDVDALCRNQTYFNRKLEKIDLYFPIIERVFREENLPDDFKYLAIQESSLISDAISTSNAVGFWQFKESSAIEVGLRVDRNIDERMHITASSRGAAKYIKKNNFFFDNWLYALLAYNTGPGGAEQHLEKKYLGKEKMEINKQTHWYIKKFLAHKIAFENEVNKNYTPALRLHEYDKTKDKSLTELANYFEIDHQVIQDYNKWLKKGKIPSDKTYLALIPVGVNDLVAQNLLGISTEINEISSPTAQIPLHSNYTPIAEFDFKSNQNYPKISKGTSTKIKINGIPGFIASTSDDLQSVLTEYSIAQQKFLLYNDMTPIDIINVGQVYYLKSKKSKANIHYHTVMAGENAWSISQKYGIKVKSLLTKNRMREEKELSPGMVLWLRFIRPENQAVEYRTADVQNVIVKSIPNEVVNPGERSSVSENGPKENVEIKSTTPPGDADSEFLFEEIDDNTIFISEKSFVKSNNKPANEKTDLSEPVKKTIDNSGTKSLKNEELYHIVKSSETMFSISRTYGVSIGELRQWNEIDDLDVLHIGQRILIKKPNESNEPPKPPDTTSQLKTHTVKQEDTLYNIARQYDMTIQELMDLNGKNDFTIKVGEVLKIKSSK